MQSLQDRDAALLPMPRTDLKTLRGSHGTVRCSKGGMPLNKGCGAADNRLETGKKGYSLTAAPRNIFDTTRVTA